MLYHHRSASVDNSHISRACNSFFACFVKCFCGSSQRAYSSFSSQSSLGHFSCGFWTLLATSFRANLSAVCLTVLRALNSLLFSAWRAGFSLLLSADAVNSGSFRFFVTMRVSKSRFLSCKSAGLIRSVAICECACSSLSFSNRILSNRSFHKSVGASNRGLKLEKLHAKAIKLRVKA